ncbi:MAG: hypothetical protein JO022_12265, partial [Acidobacteriaceae bacterium]|nr:hypothetical protein [Acidobacteriaceae bacterium]
LEAGALIAALCYVVASRLRSPAAGVIAALLTIGNQVLFTMSRRNMTDILLAAAVTTVVAILADDPFLERRRSRMAFVVAIAAGILAKSIAGLLPAVAAFVFVAVVGGNNWMRRCLRIAVLSIAGIALASPWFVYNFVAHREWFLADTGMQILSTGLRRYQTSGENHFAFYVVRLVCAAPASLVLLVAGLPRLFGSVRRREPTALLISCFLAVLVGALAVFHFHSEQYLTPVMPVVILAAVLFSPLASRRVAVPVLASLLIVFVIKASNPDRVWGISFRQDATVISGQTLSSYCEESRANPLYIIGVDDEFYALALPLAQPRYGWLDPADNIPQLRPYLVWLGIVQPVAATPDVALYGARLRQWGFPSDEPLGTALTAPSLAAFAPFVSSHPSADFLIAPELRPLLPANDTHVLRSTGPGFVLLESRDRRPAGPPAWTCAM